MVSGVNPISEWFVIFVEKPIIFIAVFVSFVILLNKVYEVSFATFSHIISILLKDTAVVLNILGITGGPSNVVLDDTIE